MKKLLAFVVAICLMVLPASANVLLPKNVAPTIEYYTAFGRAQGCKGLEVLDTASLKGPNGTFQVLKDGTPRIRMYTYPEEKAQYRIAMYYHELGHCMQYEEGTPLFAQPLIEQDADRRGADIACRAGLDGVALQLELMQYMHDTFKYDGDRTHGTLDERRAAARSAPSCIK